MLAAVKAAQSVDGFRLDKRFKDRISSTDFIQLVALVSLGEDLETISIP